LSIRTYRITKQPNTHSANSSVRSTWSVRRQPELSGLYPPPASLEQAHRQRVGGCEPHCRKHPYPSVCHTQSIRSQFPPLGIPHGSQQKPKSMRSSDRNSRMRWQIQQPWPPARKSWH